MKTLLSLLLLLCTVAATAQTAQDYTIENNELKLTKSVLFEKSTAKLLPESDEALAIVSSYLNSKTYISTFRVEGHVNTSTNETANQQLSEQRALAICKKLIANGVDCKRLIAVGFGSQKPIADNSTADGKAANTRVSFFHAGLRGYAIGGMPLDGGGKDAGKVCE